jgi:serine/threonine protein kinase
MLPVAQHNLHEYYLLASTSPDFLSLLRSFLGCLASALQYIHSIKIRHRDIKPQNILVKNDRVFLTDFGIALDWEHLSRSTTTADSGKTWTYAAPEVAKYERRNTTADVWSLGCVFMEIVTVLKGETVEGMRTFFTERTGNSRFYANIAHLPQWAKHLRSTGSPKDDVIFKWVRAMLEEDAEDRPTAATLYRDIVSECEVQSVPFCGSCCLDAVDSSDMDEDDEDVWVQDDEKTVGPGRM